MLVSADPYGTLCTPLLDREMAEDAAAGLMQQARKAGAHALILRDVALDGAAMKTFTRSVAASAACARACCNPISAPASMPRATPMNCCATRSGAKKLKELRRQRNRLAEHGEVRFDVARTPAARSPPRSRYS